MTVRGCVLRLCQRLVARRGSSYIAIVRGRVAWVESAADLEKKDHTQDLNE